MEIDMTPDLFALLLPLKCWLALEHGLERQSAPRSSGAAQSPDGDEIVARAIASIEARLSGRNARTLKASTDPFLLANGPAS
jgi:hypothetical protein